MKLLILALAALVFLPQVIPAYRGGKRCWHKRGHCRKVCKADEVVKSTCKKHQACCVSVKKDNKQVAINKKIPITTPSNFIEYYVTVVPTTVKFDIDITNKEDENYATEVGTLTPNTEVHQSS
ncbi:defensin beta 118 [Equus asinus]|uniref:defensin beta 118 n=1 Tax=Equus asinus TaxID=9793 RepID=UPI00071A52AD|nr:beta-defensin 118 [Equus asinus]